MASLRKASMSEELLHHSNSFCLSAEGLLSAFFKRGISDSFGIWVTL
jgi:hypothetical protein